MPWNTSSQSSNSDSNESQPEATTVNLNIGGAQTTEEPAIVTVDWLAAKAREKGFSKFIVKTNGIEVDDPSAFSVVAGDSVELMPYDEFGQTRSAF